MFTPMLIAAIIGIVVGYILAIPPGPIGMASIRAGIRQGWGAALSIAAGAGLFDVLYCAGAMIATSAVVDQLNNLEASSPLTTIALQFAIVGALIVFGIVQMREKTILPITEVDDKLKGARGLLDRFRRSGPFFVGIGFAIANLANPTFIPSLAAMSTFIQKLDLFPEGIGAALVFSVGFGLGNMLWLATLSRIIIAYRHRMTPRFVLRIQQFSGVTLIGFGTIYGLRILAITKWTDVFRVAFAF